MSQKLDDGGPAFPVPEDTTSWGMTVRDWFAGQALAGMHARDSFDIGQVTPEQRAKLAYRDANAMMKARKGGGGE